MAELSRKIIDVKNRKIVMKTEGISKNYNRNAENVVAVLVGCYTFLGESDINKRIAQMTLKNVSRIPGNVGGRDCPGMRRICFVLFKIL